MVLGLITPLIRPLLLWRKVFEAVDRQEITLLCLLDLSKCFNVVPHEGGRWEIWSFTLSTRGGLRATYPATTSRLSRRLPMVFVAYLRSCLTRLESTRDLLLARCRTAFTQMTCLCKMMSDDASIVQNADYVQVLVSGRPGHIRVVMDSMERNLFQICNWFGKNGMKINAQKTQLISDSAKPGCRVWPRLDFRLSHRQLSYGVAQAF